MNPFLTVEFEQNLAIVLVTGLLGGGVVASIVTAFANRRTNLSKAYADLAGSLGDLSDQVNEQQKKIRALEESNTMLAEHVARLEVMKDDLEKENLGLTAYVRSLFHWLNLLCPYLDRDFSAKHPKPHLPDALRHKIEQIGEEK